MSVSEASRTQLLIAALTVVGGLGTAVIANWDKLFPRPPAPQPSPASPSPAPSVTPPETMAAPRPSQPPCGTTIAWPAKDHLLVLGWEPVNGASTYTVEADCFGCSGGNWSSQGGATWHMREGLGLRSPIYSSTLHVDLHNAGGQALRWRVWAIDQDGRQGRKSPWCQVAFSGQPPVGR